MKLTTTLISLASLNFSFGCLTDGQVLGAEDRWTVNEIEPRGPQISAQPCPPDNTLTHENFGGPFFSRHCTGCHHSSIPAAQRGPGNVQNLESEGGVGQWIQSIYRAAVVNQTMPKEIQTTEEERAELTQYLACLEQKRQSLAADPSE